MSNKKLGIIYTRNYSTKQLSTHNGVFFWGGGGGGGGAGLVENHGSQSKTWLDKSWVKGSNSDVQRII